jgi:poly-gamma-glutamate synthesis protein (capsule biosynthesis protein)
MFLQLKRAKIIYTGAGKNREETKKISVLEFEDLKIGILAFTDNQPDWEAREDYPGVWYVNTDLDDARMHQLLNLIRTEKEKIDFLIVSAHWGGNWGSIPPAKHRLVGKALIDAGANVVYGHSAHVFRGMEIYRNSAIIYSAGDFVNDYIVHPIERNDQSFIWEIGIIHNRLQEINLYPVIIRNFQARLARNMIAQEIIKKMSQLCAQYNTLTYYKSDQGCLSVKIPQSILKL